MPDLLIERFAGPGGWDEGARLIGVTGIIGFDIDDAACRTARAAGHIRVRADVSRLRWGHLRGRVALLVDSPPCTTFSQAGKGAGRALMAEMEQLLTDVCRGRRTVAAHRRRMARLLAWSHPAWYDLPRAERAALAWREVRNATLVAEPARFVTEARPRRVALEQVPGVLPLWRLLAREWRAQGYSVWCGVLSSETFGVPQTRRRAILVASLDGPAVPPAPTHHAYRKGEPRRGFEEDLFGSGLRPWVSMAEGLGWGMTARPGLTVAGGTAAGGADTSMVGGSGARKTLRDAAESDEWVLRAGGRVRTNNFLGTTGYTGEGERVPYERDVNDPAPTLGSRVDLWLVNGNQPNTTIRTVNDQTGTPYDPQWPANRPATVVASRDLVPHPGSNANRFNRATKSRNDGYRVEIHEAAVLQSFRPDYPWQGTRTEVFRQIGDAVPPLLAAAVLGELLGVDWRTRLWGET